MTTFQKIQLIDKDDDAIQIDRARLVKVKPFDVETEKSIGCVIACNRSDGEFKGSIWLSDNYDYVLTQDSTGSICLVALEKDKKL